MVLVRSRRGRLRESDSEDVEKVSFLPGPEQVPVWLNAVRRKKGYAKYLASRFVVEGGTRLFETVALEEHQIPSKETLEKLAFAGQVSAPVTLVVTKGGKPRTISVAIAFLMEIRTWLDGRWLKLRYLWHKRTKRSPSTRVFLSDARDHEGTPISKARLYDCFHTVEPRPARWHTHFGRHTYACFYMLHALEHEATAAGRALSDMGADWVAARGAWYLKTLRKQLGHVSEETTDLYLRWLVTASGLAAAAAGWHNFLAKGVDSEVAL
jgi:integrase